MARIMKYLQSICEEDYKKVLEFEHVTALNAARLFNL